MSNLMAPISIEVVTSLKEVSEEEWNNCNSEENPFTSYAFLRALEESGSATQNTGWLSQHLILREGNGPIAAVAPLYLKNHSYNPLPCLRGEDFQKLTYPKSLLNHVDLQESQRPLF